MLADAPVALSPLDELAGTTAAAVPAAAAFAIFPPAAAETPEAAEPVVAPEPEAPRRGTRRYAHGELLLAAFIAARRPLAFEDLAGVLAGTGARVSELVTWMATSQANGLIEPDGFRVDAVGSAVGPRLYVLSDEARAELRARRGRRRTRVRVSGARSRT